MTHIVAKIATIYCFWVILALCVWPKVECQSKRSRFTEFLLLTGLVPVLSILMVIERAICWVFDPEAR